MRISEASPGVTSVDAVPATTRLLCDAVSEPVDFASGAAVDTALDEAGVSASSPVSICQSDHSWVSPPSICQSSDHSSEGAGSATRLEPSSVTRWLSADSGPRCESIETTSGAATESSS